MSFETWYKIWCDKCGAVNWLCDGDTSDMTAMDIVGFLCHQCGAANPMMEDDLDDPENYDLGLKMPT